MSVHPSSGTCDLFVELFHGLYCSGTMRVGVTLWFSWGGVVSGCRLKHFSASLAFIFHYLMLNMFRILIHPSSGACDLFVELFYGLYCWYDVCWCYGVVRLGWCGILMQVEAAVGLSLFNFRSN